MPRRIDIDEQIAFLGKYAFWHNAKFRESDDRDAWDAIARSLRKLKALEENWEEVQPPSKKKKPRKQSEMFKKFVKEYHEFCKRMVGECVFTKMDEVCMHHIIQRLTKASKEGTEEGAFLAWQYILACWGDLSVFIQNQIQVSNIEKNLLEILMQLRNGANKQAVQKKKSSRLRDNIRSRRDSRGKGD